MMTWGTGIDETKESRATRRALMPLHAGSRSVNLNSGYSTFLHRVRRTGEELVTGVLKYYRGSCFCLVGRSGWNGFEHK